MAHNSVKCGQSVVPILGLPGCGYETLGAQLPKRLNYQKKDDMGSRSNPLYENSWSYDAMYIWCKAWQASEDGKIKVWSFGGDNVTDLMWLLWPKLIVLTPVRASEWRRRANAFRKEVNLPPLSDSDVNRYCASAARFYHTLSLLHSLRSDVLVLDAMQAPEVLANEVVEYLSDFKVPAPVEIDLRNIVDKSLDKIRAMQRLQSTSRDMSLVTRANDFKDNKKEQK